MWIFGFAALFFSAEVVILFIYNFPNRVGYQQDLMKGVPQMRCR